MEESSRVDPYILLNIQALLSTILLSFRYSTFPHR